MYVFEFVPCRHELLSKSIYVSYVTIGIMQYQIIHQLFYILNVLTCFICLKKTLTSVRVALAKMVRHVSMVIAVLHVRVLMVFVA